MDSQINVVLRLQKADDQELPEHLSPHVYASASLVDQATKLDIAKAVAMEHRGTVTWELTSVFPSNCETYYRFYLISKDSVESYVADECPKRIFNPVENSETDSVVTFTLDGKLHRFAVTVLANLNGNQSTQPSELAGSNVDLEHYEIPAPLARNNSAQYAANSAESPRAQTPKSRKKADALPRNSVSIKDLVLMSSEAPTTQTESTLPSQLETSSSPEEGRKSRSIGTDPLTVRFEDHQGLYVDRSVGSSPKLLRRGSDVSMLNGDSQLHEEHEDMPEAAGAVAAAAVAERMLLPKERRQLAIVLVGLPARGKTFTAVKLTRYLRWLGHDTKHFNVGKYRRLKHGCTQSADFFRGDNQEGVDARNEVAVLAMEDMLSWMEDGGQIGVFDATNSTKERRNMILKMAEGKCKVIFLETICNDKSIIDRNINLKIQQSPDYADQTDYETARADFKARLDNYEKVYEPVDEGSYIKMIDTVTGEGGQIQVNGISGYLPGRIVFFLVNTHVTPRPILLTRHGESMYNLTGQIGGDAGLSETGEKYALKLANFITKRLKSESTASIWTSTLQRTILTASHVVGFPKVQWRALDEINAGICDGMTYEEIKDKMPEEYAARKLDKLRYRYPRGESYLDVIQRLEPVIIELERQRAPVVVIAHQAVLRSLYAYFADKPLKEIPHIEVPLHTVIEIQMGVTGIQEKRYNLMETGVCEL